ncbi:hypothetical protein SUGI_0285400 [Cryptomeria japonica]|nr:hypothetical protein SUGI_0285400 [Cryptomeria japonica]
MVRGRALQRGSIAGFRLHGGVGLHSSHVEECARPSPHRSNPAPKVISNRSAKVTTPTQPRASHNPIIENLNDLKDVVLEAMHMPSNIPPFDKAMTFDQFNVEPPHIRLLKSHNIIENIDNGNMPHVSESHPIVCDLDVSSIEVIKVVPTISNQAFSSPQVQPTSKYDLTRTNPLFEDSDGDQVSLANELANFGELKDQHNLPKSLESEDGDLFSMGGEGPFTEVRRKR